MHLLKVIHQSQNYSFNMTGDLFTMPAGPVGFSLYLEDNETDYEIDPSQHMMMIEYGVVQLQKVVVKEIRTSYSVEFAFL